MKKKREFFKPYFDGEGGDPLDIAHQYAMAAVALSGRVSAEKQQIENKREMFKSYFDGEGGDPLDIAQQSTMVAAGSSSDLPPNLQPGAFASTRYPWGDTPIQMPSNVSFKALQVIILNKVNAKKYNISKKFVDEFQVISDNYDDAVTTTEKNMYHAQGRTFYKVSKIYDAVRKYHSENP